MNGKKCLPCLRERKGYSHPGKCSGSLKATTGLCHFPTWIFIPLLFRWYSTYHLAPLDTVISAQMSAWVTAHQRHLILVKLNSSSSNMIHPCVGILGFPWTTRPGNLWVTIDNQMSFSSYIVNLTCSCKWSHLQYQKDLFIFILTGLSGAYSGPCHLQTGLLHLVSGWSTSDRLCVYCSYCITFQHGFRLVIFLFCNLVKQHWCIQWWRLQKYVCKSHWIRLHVPNVVNVNNYTKFTNANKYCYLIV